MSIASADSYINIDQPYWAKFGAAGGAISTFSTATISSLQSDEITALNINNFFLSTQILEAEEAFISSISTLGIYLDGAILTTAGNIELLLNGIPVATTSNISSLSDWSFDPAISTLNMNANNLINGALLSSLTINSGNALFTNIVANDISTTTLTVFSTIHVVSTISTFEIEAQIGLFSSINGYQFPQIITTFDTASISSLTASTINGVQFPQVIPPETTPSTITGPNTYMISNQGTNLAIANANITAGGGLYGNVAVTANPGNGSVSGGAISLTANGGSGPAGIYGAISLTANQGTDVTSGITTGGLIELNANSGGALSNLTSAVKINAGGVVSYAGVSNPLGSLYGYNYVYGTLGASVVASLLPPGVNTPGTVYLYGDNGVTCGAPFYVSQLYPYWNGITYNIGDLNISGRNTLPLVHGPAYVNLDHVSTITGDNINISGVNSINGSAYPPPAGDVSQWATFHAVQDVNILNNNIISTAGIYGNITSIQFGNIEPGALDLRADPTQGVRVLNNDATPGLLVADTISTHHIVTSDISTTTIFGTSTSIDMGGVIAGQMLLAYNNPLGFVQIIQQGVGAGRLDVGALTSVSSVNGVIYPPPAGSSTDWADYAAVSTVDMATFDIVNVNSVTAISTLIAPLVSTNNILGTNASINLASNGDINMFSGGSGRVNVRRMLTNDAAGISVSDIYLSTINNTDINNFQMSSITLKDYVEAPILYSATSALYMANTLGSDNIILAVSTPSAVVQIKNYFSGSKGILDVPILLNVSTINGLDVNNPYVSSISFPSLNINDGDGIIYADSGFAIVGNVASSSPALVFNISTVNTPIESISANEFIINVPNAGASGNELNMHVSNNEVSINVNTISGSYTPYPLAIKASNVSISSMTVSTINNAPYSALIQQNSVASLSSLTISSIATGFIFSDASVISTLIAPDLHGAGYDPPGAFPASVIDNFYSIKTANVSTTALNVSTINALQLTDHDISNVGNIQIQDGITLDGAGTISLNSSTGAPGQVIGIPLDGMYPEWVTLSTVTTVNAYVGDITVSGGGGVTITNAPTQTITITTTGGVASTDGTRTDQTIVITGITAASGAILPSYVGTDCITNGIVSVVVADDSVTVNLYANPASDAVIYWQVLSF